MKNKKLNLNSLKVTSFVTSLEKNNQETLRGGVTENCGASFNACPSVPVNDCNIASYNRTCPTLPIEQCNVNVRTVDLNLCTAINYTNVNALGC
jgi:hypothetical protein